MSDNSRSRPERRSSSAPHRDGHGGSVTVEVRRKKGSLLDRKKALQEQGGKLGEGARDPELPGSLSSAEVTTRIEALRQASRQDAPVKRIPDRVRTQAAKSEDGAPHGDDATEPHGGGDATDAHGGIDTHGGTDAYGGVAQSHEDGVVDAASGGSGRVAKKASTKRAKNALAEDHADRGAPADMAGYAAGELGELAELGEPRGAAPAGDSPQAQASSESTGNARLNSTDQAGRAHVDEADRSAPEHSSERGGYSSRYDRNMRTEHFSERGEDSSRYDRNIKRDASHGEGDARGYSRGGRDASRSYSRDGGGASGASDRGGTYSRGASGGDGRGYADRGGSRSYGGGASGGGGSRDYNRGASDHGGAGGDGRGYADRGGSRSYGGGASGSGGSRDYNRGASDRGGAGGDGRGYSDRGGSRSYGGGAGGDGRGYADRGGSRGYGGGASGSGASGSGSGSGSSGYSDRSRDGRDRNDGPRQGYRPGAGDQSAPKDERIVPVILRAASYGPSARQQAKERDARDSQAAELARRKESEGSSASSGRPPRRPERPRSPLPYESSVVANPDAPRVERPTKRRGTSDTESSDRKNARKSTLEIPKRLSRHVLTRVMDDEEETRVRSVASYRRAQKKRFGPKTEPTKVVRDVVIPDTITVSDLSNRMAVSSALVIKSLMKLGTLASINQVIDGDTAELICVEFGHRPKRTSIDDIEIGLRRVASEPDNLQVRPPVITVMGHVDHGKTSLLDALRRTNVTATEFGGITQKIGAYQIVTPYSDGKITFFDTPGHAAFSEMRARGANVTDIVVLVVAADDGINAQTLEAISHAKAAHAPIIVAINKIDKPNADPQKVKNELLNHDVVLEDFGGDIMSVEISAKLGTNLDKLIETISLQSELLELRADPSGLAEGTIVEASIERGRGIVATVLIQQGTLRCGDIFVAGAEFGRVKVMQNHLGQQVTEAGPSCPVEVLGFNGSPMAGDEFLVVDSEQKAREVADHRRQVRREKEALAMNKNSIESMMSQIASGEKKTLNIIIKADTQGSLEAIESNISKLSVSGVSSQVVHGAIGDINETDVMLAKTSNACIIGFCVKATPQARLLASKTDIVISYFTIIYEILEKINNMLKGQLAPTLEERVLGRADLRVVFTKGKYIKIAGCYVLSGLIRRSNSQIRVLRGNDVVFTGKIDTMKHEKDDIKDAKEGHECGIILDGFNDIEKGDILECFEIVEVRES